MYNYFLIVGKIESITKNTIDLDVRGEHLEVIVEFEMPKDFTVGDAVAIKGCIKENGLYADKIVVMASKEL